MKEPLHENGFSPRSPADSLTEENAALRRQIAELTDEVRRLSRELEAHQPMLNVSYLRKLLSGHVASPEEFAFLMDALHIHGDVHHYVLYCVAHRQSTSETDFRSESKILTRMLLRHLDTGYPVYHYTTLSREQVVLVTYDNAQADSLNDLQRRVMRLHDELADAASIWFYAGVGSRCTQPPRLWESYEEARSASRYTARHHIFLPYELIRKKTDCWYFPIELSAKLLHFITTGNASQADDLLALIHRENIEQRSLSVPLQNMLLSDLKHTLLKARFQIPPQTDEAACHQLNQLDEHLFAQAPTFAQLTDDVAVLCSFFTRVASPADPIDEIEQYLKDNYTDPSLSLSNVGERFNISETYLSHLFKDRTGQNFSAYIERLRMMAAAERIREAEISLSELYADIGYTSSATFRRAFKKFFGMTPREMRDRPR